MFATAEQLEQVLTAMLDSGTLSESQAIGVQTATKAFKGKLTAALAEGVKGRHITYTQANQIAKSVRDLGRAA